MLLIGNFSDCHGDHLSKRIVVSNYSLDAENPKWEPRPNSTELTV